MAVTRQRKQIYAFSFDWQLPSCDAPTHLFLFKGHPFLLIWYCYPFHSEIVHIFVIADASAVYNKV